MSPEKQAVLDALTAERYGPSLWWKTPEPAAGSAVILERRRMLLEFAEEEEIAESVLADEGAA
jgi:hypothetical protein